MGSTLAGVTKCTEQVVLGAIADVGGKATDIATYLEVEPYDIHNWTAKWPAVRAARKLARTIKQEETDEILLDHAEAALLVHVIKGHAWAVKLALTMKGWMRGYTLNPAPLEVKLEPTAELVKLLSRIYPADPPTS